MATKKSSTTRTVTRDAGNGRFVKPRRAVTHPTRTVTETVKKSK